jgi:hypothetical protein
MPGTGISPIEVVQLTPHRRLRMLSTCSSSCHLVVYTPCTRQASHVHEMCYNEHDETRRTRK